MPRVRLDTTEAKRDTPDLALTFIQKANEQGFDVDWIEMVISKIEKSYYHNAREILLEHIDITDK